VVDADEECILNFIRGILKGCDHWGELEVEGGISTVVLEQGCGLGSFGCEQGLVSGCHEEVFEP
jgi:hypothetical protein